MEPGGHSSDELQHQTVRSCFNFDLHYQFDMARSATRLYLIFGFTYLWGGCVYVSVRWICSCECAHMFVHMCEECLPGLPYTILLKQLLPEHGTCQFYDTRRTGFGGPACLCSLALGLQTLILDRGVGDPNLEPCVSLSRLPSFPLFYWVEAQWQGANLSRP